MTKQHFVTHQKGPNIPIHFWLPWLQSLAKVSNKIELSKKFRKGSFIILQDDHHFSTSYFEILRKICKVPGCCCCCCWCCCCCCCCFYFCCGCFVIIVIFVVVAAVVVVGKKFPVPCFYSNIYLNPYRTFCIK